MAPCLEDGVILYETNTVRFGKSHLPKLSEAQLVCNFSKLMFEGKTKAALRLVSGYQRGGVLNLDEIADSASPGHCVRDVLRAKHPPAQPLDPKCLLQHWADPPCRDGGVQEPPLVKF